MTANLRAVVAKHPDDGHASIIATMPVSLWELMDESEWLTWRSKALALVLSYPPVEEYDVREVTLKVQQAAVDSVFDVQTITADVDPS
jgi:hypothetical protein